MSCLKPYTSNIKSMYQINKLLRTIVYHECIYFNQKYKKPIGFELSTIMHMYYAFCNYIYSFSSMATYVLLVWQTYFLSVIYTNTFEIVHASVSVQNANNH